MFTRASIFPATLSSHECAPSSGHYARHQVAPVSPGHRLLPLWPELIKALPRLGPVCAVSRNQHAVLGGICVYPDAEGCPADPDALQFHHNLSAWNEGWYYREMVNGESLSGIEFRDRSGMGFHKVVFTDDSDMALAHSLVHAFEQEALTLRDVSGAFKANQLDGTCCAKCEATLSHECRSRVAELEEFITAAIELECSLRVVLAHTGLVSVRRFIPRRLRPQGLWQSVAGDGVTLFLRTSGIGELEFSQIQPPDSGPCQVATLSDRSGNLIASLIMEE